MAYFDNGMKVFKLSFKVFFRHPVMIVPLLLTWLVYAPTVLYLKYGFDWEHHSRLECMEAVFLEIMLFSLVLSLSCLILLEFIRQIETDGHVSFWRAFMRAYFLDLLPAFPITLLWAIIWFVLVVLEAIFSKAHDSGDDKGGMSLEGTAETISGYKHFSLSGAFFDALQKGVRMLAFLILPAIAWEEDGTIKALKRGLGIARARKWEFGQGFALTYVFAGFIFLPPWVLFEAHHRFHVDFPDTVWVATIIYCGFAWSVSILVEQMFTATLYLWHLKWEQLDAKARAAKTNRPLFYQVPCPSILDGSEHLLLKGKQVK